MKREYSLDLIRIAAVILVISNHFFLCSGFYNEIVAGKRMYLLVLIRTFTLICVPLFIVLTGYLMSQKSFGKKYYRGITKTLCIYLLASIACLINRDIITPHFYDVKDAVLDILGFRAAPYSWYIEMYIGLFLLIPFLNLIYGNLHEKKQKQALLMTLLFLTSVPTMFNIYNFYLEGWWQEPALSASYQKLLPGWWESIYPLTYYFIGCYLREYKIELNKRAEAFLLVLLVFFYGTFCFYRFHNSSVADVAGEYQEWGALLNVAVTVLVFDLLAGMKRVNSFSKWIRQMIKGLSELTLGAYLVSSIFDERFYLKLNEKIDSVPHKLEYFFVIVPMVLICSFGLSFIINLLYYGMVRVLPKVSRRLYNE